MTKPAAVARIPTVSVLVVNWNAGRLLEACLDSIPAGVDGLDFEVIVVDNGSTDGSLERLAARPWLRLQRRRDNSGFAVASNQAARLARGRQLLLLNPDTVCRPGSIRTLSEHLDASPELAAVGPRLFGADDRPQRSAWRGYPDLAFAWVDALYLWKLPGLPGVRRSEVQPAAADDRPLPVDHLLGACILIRREAWEAVGPLDEGYFLFFEETDWCRRVRKAGHGLELLPTAEVRHHGEHSVYQVPRRSIPQYYHSFHRFVCAGGAGPNRLLLLRLAFRVAALVRVLLWGLRRLGPRSEFAREMQRAYALVLRRTPGPRCAP